MIQARKIKARLCKVKNHLIVTTAQGLQDHVDGCSGKRLIIKPDLVIAKTIPRANPKADDARLKRIAAQIMNR